MWKACGSSFHENLMEIIGLVFGRTPRRADWKGLLTSGFRAKLDFSLKFDCAAGETSYCIDELVAGAGQANEDRDQRYTCMYENENELVSMAKLSPHSFRDFLGRGIPGINTSNSTYSSSNGTKIILFRNESPKFTKIYHRYSRYSCSSGTFFQFYPFPKNVAFHLQFLSFMTRLCGPIFVPVTIKTFDALNCGFP